MATLRIGDIAVGSIIVGTPLDLGSSGVGSLTASLAPQTPLSGALSALGVLSGPMTPSLSASSPMAGEGTLSAVLMPSTTASAALSGLGSLTTTPTSMGMSLSGGLLGIGVLSSALSGTLTGAMPVDLEANGLLSAVHSATTATLGSLGSDGQLSAVIISEQQVSSAVELSGSGVLSATLDVTSDWQDIAVTARLAPQRRSARLIQQNPGVTP